MSARHIILKANGRKWRAAYSDQPDDEFEGNSTQAAIDALVAAKGRRDPKQSSAQIDIAEMLAKAERQE